MEIKINNLTKKYKDVIAVNNVSFSIHSNELFALLGVNGAGKTTTIKILTGLTRKTSGNVSFGELDLEKDMEKIKKFSNVSMQETAVAENLTVKENIEFIAKIYGLSKQEVNQKTNELLESFDLLNVKNKQARLLSGGMQRRLSIAMSLVTNPQILYLDEPTLGLDVLSRQQLWEFILKLKNKITIVLTTHYIEEAENLADRVAIMYNGKIVDLDTPKNLVDKTNSKNLEQAFVKIVKEAK